MDFYGQLLPLTVQLNEQLNQAKDLLSGADFEYLKQSNPFDREIRILRQELTKRSGAQNMTRAGLKMLEMLQRTPLGDWLLSLERSRILFNAELPGSFLFTVNHFLKTQGKNFDWVLSSFLPRNPQEMERSYLEDTFDLIGAHPGQVLVGEIRTNKGIFWSDGDLTNPRVPRILAQLSGPVDLYTADGGFDVRGQENLQEELSLPLIRGEIETGFRTLKVGGAFVLKLFTLFTPEMLSNLLVLMRAFDSYWIFKPSTSGPTNSESYFIGMGYRGGSEITGLEILEGMTGEEYEFLRNHLDRSVQTQIQSILKFLGGRSLPMPFQPTVDLLDRSDWIPTGRD